MTLDEYTAREQELITETQTAKAAFLACVDDDADQLAVIYKQATLALYIWHDRYEFLVTE